MTIPVKQWASFPAALHVAEGTPAKQDLVATLQHCEQEGWTVFQILGTPWDYQVVCWRPANVTEIQDATSHPPA